MKILSLDGSWKFRQAGTDVIIPGHVPGDVMTDLYRAKRIPDPFYRENEKAVQWIGEKDWIYERGFQVPVALLSEERIKLQCQGLDTFAKVQINGRTIARTDNMHRSYEWDIKPMLKAGLNSIRITFNSVNGYTREQLKKRFFYARVGESHPGAYPAFVRKEACNFGWDWGPILVTCGIWRTIRIAAFSEGRIGEVEVRQAHRKDRVNLSVKVGLDLLSRKALKVKATVLYKGKAVAEKSLNVRGARGSDLSLSVKDPQLWWPNGMGAQPLYDVKVELFGNDGAVLDAKSKRIGLRTLRLDRQKDQWGESFRFKVNGVPFFSKGANWIPADALLGRRTPALYRSLIEDAAAVNMNMLRVWGGGIYEDDCFYDLCDELGICVWQDFMFACMSYPTWDKAFMKNVEAEARDNVRRLRHHACLAILCGNNELEQQAVDFRNTSGGKRMSLKEYVILFDGLLARVSRELAPETDYWPSSPHSPHGDRADHSNPECGDAHLWDVWHGRKPFEWYRTCGHRFNSEFGFQSFPEPKTVCGYTEKQDRNVTTAVMEHHQRSGIGNTTIMQYMLDWFRLPSSFDMNLWTSQILQGMAIKYAVEHWRRSMPRGMGTLYWQINDVWPVASWSSIDFHGRWKALHYMARHFFAPVLVSGLEDKKNKTIEIHVTNDLLAAKTGRLAWTVTNAAGRNLLSGGKNVRIPANASGKVETLRLGALMDKHGARDLLVWLELKVDGQPKLTNLVTFGRPKHLELAAKPHIKTAITGKKDGSFRVTLRTAKPALWAWLELEAADARMSDNFVHLRPGKAVSIDICPARKLGIEQVRGQLKVRSLVDTFAV